MLETLQTERISNCLVLPNIQLDYMNLYDLTSYINHKHAFLVFPVDLKFWLFPCAVPKVKYTITELVAEATNLEGMESWPCFWSPPYARGTTPQVE